MTIKPDWLLKIKGLQQSLEAFDFGATAIGATASDAAAAIGKTDPPYGEYLSTTCEFAGKYVPFGRQGT